MSARDVMEILVRELAANDPRCPYNAEACRTMPIDREYMRDSGYGQTADAILSALTAAGLVVEQGWQPIATAPRDGTRVLVCEHDAPLGDVSVDWLDKDGKWLGSPTHWRPLPAPPAAQETPDGP